VGRYYAGPEDGKGPVPEEDPEYNAALFRFFAACLKRFGPIPTGSVIEIHAMEPNPAGAPLLMVYFSIPGGP
jgi:hypothetical protein